MAEVETVTYTVGMKEYNLLVRWATELIADRLEVSPEFWVRQELKRFNPKIHFSYTEDKQGRVSVADIVWLTEEAISAVTKLISEIYQIAGREELPQLLAKLGTSAPAYMIAEFGLPSDADYHKLQQEVRDFALAQGVAEFDLEVAWADTAALPINERVSTFQNTVNELVKVALNGPAKSPFTTEQQTWLQSQSAEYQAQLLSLPIDQQAGMVELDMMISENPETATEPAPPVEAIDAAATTLASPANIASESIPDDSNGEFMTEAEIAAEPLLNEPEPQLPAVQTEGGIQVAEDTGEVLNPAEAFELLGVVVRNEQFAIRSEEEARWFIDLIVSRQERMNRLAEQTAYMIGQEKKAVESLMTYFGPQLRQYVESILPRHTKGEKAGMIRGKSQKFPEGTVFFRKTGGVYVRDFMELDHFIQTLPEDKFEKYGVTWERKYSRTTLKKMAEAGEAIPGLEHGPVQELGEMKLGTGRAGWSFNTVKKILSNALSAMDKRLGVDRDEEEEAA